MAQPDPARPGLLWSTDGDNAEPVWEYEPQLKDITRVCQWSLNIGIDQCKVSFLDEGQTNKIYLVETHQGKYIMRVSLPVDPVHKVNAEVLVHQWLREVTRVPLPEIYDYQSHSKNNIGFEWILMQYVPGQSAFYRWRKMDMAEKTVLVERIAECQADIISKSRTSNFRGIGSLERNGDNIYIPGRIVAIDFCQGDHYNYNLQRGPFPCSRDWLQTLLNIVTTGLNRKFKRARTNKQKASHQHYLAVAERLRKLVVAAFPTSEWEPTVLWHSDLSLSNIMLGKSNELESIIDWECVSAMPLWVATRVPKFLKGRDRHKAPSVDGYGSSDEGESSDEDGLDKGGKSTIWWEHRLEYEQTKLRKVYNERMGQLDPEWVKVRESSAHKNDLLNAINSLSIGFGAKRIEKWLDKVERGKDV